MSKVVYYVFITVFSSFIYETVNTPIPIQLQGVDQVAKMKFHLQLPTNETVQIHLSFKLLTPSKPFPVYAPQQLVNATSSNESDEAERSSETTTQLSIIIESESSAAGLNDTTGIESLELSTTPVSTTTTTTTTTTPTSDTSEMITVEEAIESFRKDLIRKEMEIAGIIESEHPFYRHFTLEYGDNIQIPIRCTYIANFEEQLLAISCYEYREVGSRRIFSNGEYEMASLTYIPEFIDAKKMKQTSSMTIV